MVNPTENSDRFRSFEGALAHIVEGRGFDDKKVNEEGREKIINGLIKDLKEINKITKWDNEDIKTNITRVVKLEGDIKSLKDEKLIDEFNKFKTHFKPLVQDIKRLETEDKTRRLNALIKTIDGKVKLFVEGMSNLKPYETSKMKDLTALLTAITNSWRDSWKDLPEEKIYEIYFAIDKISDEINETDNKPLKAAFKDFKYKFMSRIDEFADNTWNKEFFNQELLRKRNL